MIEKAKYYSTILQPVITEKSAMVGSGTNTVVFRVDPRATKTDVKRAIEEIFAVKVKTVRTSNQLGKVKRTSKSMGRAKSHKKAFVTLHEGHKIDIVEGL